MAVVPEPVPVVVLPVDPPVPEVVPAVRLYPPRDQLPDDAEVVPEVVLVVDPPVPEVVEDVL